MWNMHLSQSVHSAFEGGVACYCFVSMNVLCMPGQTHHGPGTPIGHVCILVATAACIR